MEPRFETRQFKLVGLEAVVDMTGPFGQEVDALWSTLGGRADEVTGKVEPVTWVGFWFMPDGGNPNESGYMAAVATQDADHSPAGMASRELPSSQFAVFTETQRGEVGGPGGYAYNTWLPASGFEFNDALGGDLEVYAAPPCGPYEPCEIWIPVRRKE